MKRKRKPTKKQVKEYKQARRRDIVNRRAKMTP